MVSTGAGDVDRDLLGELIDAVQKYGRCQCSPIAYRCTCGWSPLAKRLKRALMNNVEYRGEHCQVCGMTYGEFVYRVPDDVWAVITPKPESPGAGLLCPSCAAIRATEAGIYLEWEARRG